MAIYAIEWLVDKSKKITSFLSFKFNFYRKLIKQNKFYSKFFRIESIIVIFILTSAVSTYYMNRWPDYHYDYDDELVETVLYLREKAEPNSKILRQDFENAVIFQMLYDMKVKIWNLNDNSTYLELLNEINKNDIDYFIFPKDFFNDVNIEIYLEQNPIFKEKLENDEFILYKI
jgi:hypothetical protein